MEAGNEQLLTIAEGPRLAAGQQMKRLPAHLVRAAQYLDNRPSASRPAFRLCRVRGTARRQGGVMAGKRANGERSIFPYKGAWGWVCVGDHTRWSANVSLAMGEDP